MRKGYLEGDVEKALYVGAKDTDGGYVGPQAEITFDKDWLKIITDEYEGVAMLNIESLPFLRRALSLIDKKIKAAAALTPAKVDEAG